MATTEEVDNRESEQEYNQHQEKHPRNDIEETWILTGSMSDPKSLPDMIEKLSVKASTPNDKTLVVMDTDISRKLWL